MKQLSFLKSPTLYAGGSLQVGHRKNRRPLCSKRPLHLVLKSNSQNLFQKKEDVLRFVRRYSQGFHIKSYGISVQKDHIHFLIKVPSRLAYVKFIRALTGMLTRSLRVNWKYVPFTRVVSWGRAFKQVLAYLRKNDEEVLGLRPYELRRQSRRFQIVT